MIFCKKCGEPLPDDAKFCMNCGASLEDTGASGEKEQSGPSGHGGENAHSSTGSQDDAGGTAKDHSTNGGGNFGDSGKIDFDKIYPGYSQTQSAVKRKISIPLLVITIINTLFFSVAGAFAFIFLFKARSAPDEFSEKRCIRNAIIANVVAFIIGLAYIYYYAPTYFLLQVL